MFIDVIPTIKLPRSLEIFTYRLPEALTSQIQPGQLVAIPFRSKIINGIITRVHNDQPNIPDNRIKEITKIIIPDPIITREQILLFNWLREYYLCNLNIIYKTFIPKIPKKFKPTDGKRLPTKQKTSSDNLPSARLIYYEDKTKKNQYLLDLIKQNIEDNYQTVIFFPEVQTAENFREFLIQNLPETPPEFITGKMTPKKYWEAWQRIKDTKVKIILGTKTAIGLPFSNLHEIIADDEDSPSHKNWDQNPRYHVRETVFELAKLHHADLTLTTQNPSAETYYQIMQKQLEPIVLNSEQPLPHISLVDMRDEYTLKNFTALSTKLIDGINNALDKPGQIVLILNNKIYSRRLSCRDCGNEISCPHCAKTLAYSDETKTMYCPNCSATSPVPVLCPNCKSPKLKFGGFGLEKIPETLHQNNINVPIISLTAETKTIATKDAKIIIGTEELLQHNWTNISLVGVISADTFLYIPDPRSAEKTYRLLNQIINKTQAETTAAPIVIQTRYPEHHAIYAAINRNSKIFYKKELTVRRALGYPPFCRLIKLIHKNANQKLGLEEGTKTYHWLKLSIKNSDNSIVTNPPSEINSTTPEIHRFQIILKLTANYDIVNSLLKKLPDSWLIDVDPIEIT